VSGGAAAASGGASIGRLGASASSDRCASSDRPTATPMRWEDVTGPAPYLPRRMITLPKTETAMPAQVSGCQRKPSNAAEITRATIGTMTPM
jgi:hypothetical protein